MLRAKYIYAISRVMKNNQEGMAGIIKTSKFFAVLFKNAKRPDEEISIFLVINFILCPQSSSSVCFSCTHPSPIKVPCLKKKSPE